MNVGGGLQPGAPPAGQMAGGDVLCMLILLPFLVVLGAIWAPWRKVEVDAGGDDAHDVAPAAHRDALAE